MADLEDAMAYGLEFERFIAPARLRPAIWRILLGLIVMAIVYVAVGVVILFGVSFWIGETDPMWLASKEALSRPVPLLLVLATFVGMALAPMVAVWALHGRKPRTLFGRAPRVLGDFAKTAAVYLAIGLPAMAIWITVSDTKPGLPPLVWLAFFPLALIAVLIQTMAEELVFRGYFQQQLAARFNSPFVWLWVPSLIFGLLHFDGQLSLGSAITVVGVTTLFGLVAADLTARTGSIGAAWGFHFANNIMALCFVSVDGTLTGLALFRTGFSIVEQGMPSILVLGDVTMLLTGWIITCRVLGR